MESNMKRARPYIVIAVLWIACALLGVAIGPLMVPAVTEASGGPAVGRRVVCDDGVKAGTVELRPNGTANAQVEVYFAIPFCSDDISVTTGVQSHNTAGERTGHNVLSPGLMTVSIQLDTVSSDDYDVDWQAMVKTQ